MKRAALTSFPVAWIGSLVLVAMLSASCGSVLYGNVLGLKELDEMGEDF